MSLQTTLFIYAAFLVLEALFPRKKWVMFQKEFPLDLIFVAVNAYLFWLIEWNLYGIIEKYFCVSLHMPALHLIELPLWGQVIILFLCFDFLRYWTHRFLHSRHGWRIHKTHHHIKYLHCLRALYYNPLENIVYMISTLPILFLFHFSWEVFAILATIDAIIGLFNHSNLKIRIPNILAKIINTPQVHIWHHDESHKNGSRKNFGINLSLWDWIFGTLYIDEKDPKKIGER